MHDVDRTIDDLRREVPGAVERALGYAYRRGGAVASVEAEAAGITGSFGFMPDEEALTRLLSEAMRPHEQVILGIRRSVNDAYDQALVKAAGYRPHRHRHEGRCGKDRTVIPRRPGHHGFH